MTALTAIRDYLRWIRRWRAIDYTADNWREQNEQRWNAFCSWRAGELPEDIDAAVAMAQMELLNGTILESFLVWAHQLNDAIGTTVTTFALFAEAIGNSLSSMAMTGADRE